MEALKISLTKSHDRTHAARNGSVGAYRIRTGRVVILLGVSGAL